MSNLQKTAVPALFPLDRKGGKRKDLNRKTGAARRPRRSFLRMDAYFLPRRRKSSLMAPHQSAWMGRPSRAAAMTPLTVL